MIKTIQRRLDAILHWNISFVGGFLGGYAILSHAGVFGSAQTGNLMEMASNVRFMEGIGTPSAGDGDLRLRCDRLLYADKLYKLTYAEAGNLGGCGRSRTYGPAAGLVLADCGCLPDLFLLSIPVGCIFRRRWFQQRDGFHHKQLQTIRPRLDAVCVDER